MKPDAERHFEKLVALNLEGIASTQEENELWKVVKTQTAYIEKFFQARKTDYLLRAFLDEAASEKQFANRVLNALHPDRLSKKEFVAAVQKKLQKPAPTMISRYSRWPVWKMAASIILVLGSIGLFQKFILRPNARQTNVAQVREQHLRWDFDPVISTLEKKMASLSAPGNTVAYRQPRTRHNIIERVSQMDAQITRMGKQWHNPKANLFDDKNGEPL